LLELFVIFSFLLLQILLQISYIIIDTSELGIGHGGADKEISELDEFVFNVKLFNFLWVLVALQISIRGNEGWTFFNVIEHFRLKNTLKVFLGLYLCVVREVLAVDPEPVDNLSQFLIWRVLKILYIFKVPIEAGKVVENRADFLK